jgi:hypothetical protein
MKRLESDSFQRRVLRYNILPKASRGCCCAVWKGESMMEITPVTLEGEHVRLEPVRLGV